MTQVEAKFSQALSYPYDAFLMVRLEFVQICQEELEAKLLRIIEKYVEIERKRIYQQMVNGTPGTTPHQEPLDIPKDIWVPISYRLFMSDLFGTVTSENTLKKALKSLVEKKLIFQCYEPTHRYDAPKYKLHIPVLQSLLGVLSSGGQFLIPSVIDALKNSPPQELTPSGCQELIASCALRVSKIDPNYNSNYDNSSNNNTREREALATSRASSQSSHVSQDDEETQKRQAVNPSQKGTDDESRPITPSSNAHREPMRSDRNDSRSDSFSHSQKKVVPPKRPRQKPITMEPPPISPEAQRILDDWVSLFKKKIAINQGDIAAAEHLAPTHITKEEMSQEKAWLFSTDNPKRPWYRKIGVCLADIDKKYTQWLSLQEAPPEKKASNGRLPATNAPIGLYAQFNIKPPVQGVMT